MTHLNTIASIRTSLTKPLHLRKDTSNARNFQGVVAFQLYMHDETVSTLDNIRTIIIIHAYVQW